LNTTTRLLSKALSQIRKTAALSLSYEAIEQSFKDFRPYFKGGFEPTL
jgi:hypothetical protein